MTFKPGSESKGPRHHSHLGHLLSVHNGPYQGPEDLVRLSGYRGLRFPKQWDKPHLGNLQKYRGLRFPKQWDKPHLGNLQKYRGLRFPKQWDKPHLGN